MSNGFDWKCKEIFSEKTTGYSYTSGWSHRAVSRFGSGGLDDSNTQKLLEKAFEFEKAKAIK